MLTWRKIVQVNAMFIARLFLPFDFHSLLHVGFHRQIQTNPSSWLKWFNSKEVFGPRIWRPIDNVQYTKMLNDILGGFF